MREVLIASFLTMVMCCTTSQKVQINTQLQDKPQSFLERIETIERQDLVPDLFLDSVSMLICESLIEMNISLLDSKIENLRTYDQVVDFVTDTTLNTWQDYRIGMLIRSVSAFKTNGDRLPQSIIESLDKETRSICPDRYSFFLEVEKKQDYKIQQVVAEKLNAN